MTKNKLDKLVVIKTVRDLNGINEGIKNGFKPLIKKLEQSHLIVKQYCIIQNKITGEVIKLSNIRTLSRINKSEYDILIDWTGYYPYHFESPFAAYLIPSDLEVGQRVLLEDLIEDLVGASWQASSSRLEKSEAIWNGKDFEIDYDFFRDVNEFIG
jgi:hypothetical protein